MEVAIISKVCKSTSGSSRRQVNFERKQSSQKTMASQAKVNVEGGGRGQTQTDVRRAKAAAVLGKLYATKAEVVCTSGWEVKAGEMVTNVYDGTPLSKMSVKRVTSTKLRARTVLTLTIFNYLDNF